MLHVVIMAGGSGTRFWPQSRRRLPKQFLKIGTEQTLIQETAARCLPLIAPPQLWVVAGAVHAAETAHQLPELPGEQVLIEPCARNTAPCIGLAAIQLLAVDPEAVMLVVPADHVISPAEVFQQAVRDAVRFVTAQPDSFVLFGVKPDHPATGFGYIHRTATTVTGEEALYRVAAFKEKPDPLTAAKYVASDEYLWNCGIFVWKAQALLDALAVHQPELHAGLARLREAIGTDRWPDALATEFPKLPSISIDYAVLEHAQNVYVLPAAFQWDDVGSWLAVSRLHPQDDDGNTIDGLHCGVDTDRCIIRSTDDHLVTTIGVKDLIIVHTPEATLVADQRDEAAVKKLLAELERRGLSQFL
ncbi:MAG: mannose-1-phosphate guanylyltransferase [Planctomycetaceae bacterium]|nr:mannose-1-phosphate guanylyltransferase [Planctomycetaceae bacterium]